MSKFSNFSYVSSDAIGLARAISAGVLSPAEAVSEARNAIAALNPELNAVIALTDELADRQLNALPSGPLSGVPVLLKDDCPSYAGAPMSFGSRAARGNVSERNHEIVNRYLANGLVILGKTNLPEFSCNVATEPSLSGRTRNPWHPERSVGGSSGGAAAAVAARMVPIAYANDGAGSIRIPASFTGLFGLRPSRGRTPTGPVSAENWGGLVSHHVLTRSVRDSALMLDLTSGLEPGAMYAAPTPKTSFLEAAAAAPGPMRIGVLDTYPLGVTIDPEVARAFSETEMLMKKLGHELIPIRPDFDAEALAGALADIVAVYTAMEVADVAEQFGVPATEDYFEPANLALKAYGESLSATTILRARNRLSATARSFGRLFENCDVLMTPTVPELPPLTGRPDARSSSREAFIADFLSLSAFCHPANAAGNPAMSVPLHTSNDGLPIGIQVVGPYGGEAVLFSLAGQLEAASPWQERLPPVCHGGAQSV